MSGTPTRPRLRARLPAAPSVLCSIPFAATADRIDSDLPFDRATQLRAYRDQLNRIAGHDQFSENEATESGDLHDVAAALVRPRAFEAIH